MSNNLPFSLDNIPRQRGVGCLSLRILSIVSGLLFIIYSVLGLANCILVLETLPREVSTTAGMALLGLFIGVTITHAITLFLSTLMVVGAIKEQKFLIRPWVTWTSIQVMVLLLMFVYWTIMMMINYVGDSSLWLTFMDFIRLLAKFYMLMLVGSYYKQLEENEGEQEKLVKILSKEYWHSA